MAEFDSRHEQRHIALPRLQVELDLAWDLAGKFVAVALVLVDKPGAPGKLAQPNKLAGLDRLFRQIQAKHLAHARLVPFEPATAEHIPASAPKTNFAQSHGIDFRMSCSANRSWLANWNTDR